MLAGAAAALAPVLVLLAVAHLPSSSTSSRASRAPAGRAHDRIGTTVLVDEPARSEEVVLELDEGDVAESAALSHPRAVFAGHAPARQPAARNDPHEGVTSPGF